MSRLWKRVVVLAVVLAALAWMAVRWHDRQRPRLQISFVRVEGEMAIFRAENQGSQALQFRFSEGPRFRFPDQVEDYETTPGRIFLWKETIQPGGAKEFSVPLIFVEIAEATPENAKAAIATYKRTGTVTRSRPFQGGLTVDDPRTGFLRWAPSWADNFLPSSWTNVESVTFWSETVHP
jgi:hypothetical protein